MMWKMRAGKKEKCKSFHKDEWTFVSEGLAVDTAFGSPCTKTFIMQLKLYVIW